MKLQGKLTFRCQLHSVTERLGQEGQDHDGNKPEGASDTQGCIPNSRPSSSGLWPGQGARATLVLHPLQDCNPAFQGLMGGQSSHSPAAATLMVCLGNPNKRFPGDCQGNQRPLDAQSTRA